VLAGINFLAEVTFNGSSNNGFNVSDNFLQRILHGSESAQQRGGFVLAGDLDVAAQVTICNAIGNIGYPEKVVGFGFNELRPATSFSGSFCGFWRLSCLASSAALVLL
jgi:hypothetical protein